MQNGHSKIDALQRTLSSLLNNIVTDLQALTKIIKTSSKKASEVNASIINRMVLTDKGELIVTVKQLLTHLLQIIEIKGVGGTVLVILSKVVSLIKIFSDSEKAQKIQELKELGSEFDILLNRLVDIVFFLSNKCSDSDMILRIIQTTYSLIEPSLLKYADYTLATRIYSICFRCCLSTSTIQSISVSAIYSLTEILFSNRSVKELEHMLVEFLDLMLRNKKSQWIKQITLKNVIWDVVLIAVKNIPRQQWEFLARNLLLVELLNEMYRIAMDNSFTADPGLVEHDIFKHSIHLESGVSHALHQHQKRDLMSEYIKFYKVFVYFSIHLSLRLKEQEELVPFRKNIGLFHRLYDFPRTVRFYIMLEGISLIVSNGSSLILEQEGGIMLVDVFQKVCEQLYSSKMPFQVVWQNSDLLLEKILVDYSRITDQDYLKLTKNMLVQLRKSFQNIKQPYLREAVQQSGADMSTSLHRQSSFESKQSGIAYRWRRLIKSVIRIIRYLTSLKFRQNSNDQAIRRFLMELQYWFMICPNNKTRNTILLEFQSITNNIQNENQAIKASQSMQICANILYGFYGVLNSVGVSIVIRILANIKVNYQMGRDFNQLDEVCQMADKFYIEQRIISSEEEFKITIQGFVQGLNLMVADMQQPKSNQEKNKDSKERGDKYLKLIDYVLLKLRFVLEQNSEYLQKHWKFIVCFWVAMCSNKHSEIRMRTLAHIESVVAVLLKNSMVSQFQIMALYVELSKLEVKEVSLRLIENIKHSLLYLKDEEALVQIFSIVKQIISKKYADVVRSDLFELQEMLIKDSLFKIKSQKCLSEIIDALSFQGKCKNEQYQTVSLLWTIADHLNVLNKENKWSQQRIWLKLCQKIISFARITDHPGTLQSCIHTFTQIIADCSKAIGTELFVKILVEQYISIFCLLMSFQQNAPKLQIMAQVDMEKVAVKNFIKLTKKCITDKAEGIPRLFEASASNLLKFINKAGHQLPIQYFIELCQLLQYYREIITECKERNQQIINVQSVQNILEAMEGHHEHLDKTSYFWKKKYEPTFFELKAFFKEK